MKAGSTVLGYSYSIHIIMIPFVLTEKYSDLANECDVDYSKLLGCGGFGNVCAANDTHSGRAVAIKLIQTEKSKLWIEVNRVKLSQLNRKIITQCFATQQDRPLEHVVLGRAQGDPGFVEMLW
jgi:hypothetical protein